MSIETEWIPRTKLGLMVQNGEVISISEIFSQGLKIKEAEIIDILIPDLKQEVLGINLVQKQTDAGERSKFKAVVVVGNEKGYIGIGTAKAKQVRAAIEKATIQAKLNIIPVKRGCGSWECGCDVPHSLPFKIKGKSGSVRFEAIPGPRGLGLVAGEQSKIILNLAGINDCWVRSSGSTSTLQSIAYATFDALRSTYKLVSPTDWGK
jgi:small subunit ribosomal protein S5